MKLTAILATLLISNFAFSKDEIQLHVKLNPTGSFIAKSDKPKGKLTKSGNGFTADKITVSIQSFKTGIDLRDEHFWKHLNSEKFPRATLSNLKANGGKATANLEVAGNSKPVEISYSDSGSSIKAKFEVDAKDFNLPQASYLGVGVDNKVLVEVEMDYK